MISYVLAGAASALIGLASGQLLVLSAGRRRLATRLSAVEQQLPELISRSEVQNAFAQVAQIEAQRQSQAQAQARAAAVFGQAAAPVAPRAEFNGAINAQLEALQERINRINSEFGLS
jgi:lysophospholipase L1-like esterase